MKERIEKMKNSEKKGFTLIELVVVIAILAILALIMVPNLTAYLGKAKEAKIQANMKNVHTASEMVRQTEGSLIEESIKTFSNNEDVIVSESEIADENLDADKYTVTNKGGQTVVKYKTQDGKVFTFPDGNEYLATDDDFEGTTNGSFKYTGTETTVKIPHIIKGVPVTSYKSMFYNTLVERVISDNPNVTDMINMFGYSQATELDLSNFDTSNVTDMYAMFYGSQATSLDLSSFNTSNVTNMREMFGYSQATSLDLSSFDTSNVTDMRYMFQDSQAISLDLSSFNTSNVTSMRSMFWRSQATSLDLSSFDTSSVTDMSYMFDGSQATSGYARTQADADKFNTSSNKPSELTFVVK